MIKRNSAFLFILLANINLLVHAVVPHHHHETEVCIVNSNCQDDDEMHGHGSSQHSHEHDGEKDSAHCNLRQIFITPSNQTKHEINGSERDAFPFQTNALHVILFNAEYHGVIPAAISILHPPPKLLHFTNFVSTGLGLRAPPMV